MGIIKDPTSWRAGFELGLAGFSFPYSKPRKPTAYLYNGIRLPALPEWDRGVYPFAFISQMAGGYRLTASVYPVRKTTGFTPYWWYDGATLQFYGDAIRFWCEDGLAWGSGEAVNINATDASKMIWSDYDVIHNGSGEVEFTASEPVPVYD